MNEQYVDSNYSNRNHAYVSDQPGATQSPIDSQLDQLNQRLESTYQAFVNLQQRVGPILSPPPVEQKGPIPQEVGCSPLHDRLLTLNAKASAFARAVDETIDRVTI